MARWVRQLPRGGGRRHGVLLHVCVLGAAIYGSYFGAGLGVMSLAVLGVLMHETLAESKELKKALSLLINTVALVVFAVFGPVDWMAVAVMPSPAWPAVSAARSWLSG